MKENEELKKANEKLETLSQDEKMKRLAELREKAIYEYNTATNSGFRKGMKNGLEEGIEQGKNLKTKEIALELLKNNISIEIIKATTGLSYDEIKDLEKSLKTN